MLTTLGIWHFHKFNNNDHYKFVLSTERLIKERNSLRLNKFEITIQYDIDHQVAISKLIIREELFQGLIEKNKNIGELKL